MGFACETRLVRRTHIIRVQVWVYLYHIPTENVLGSNMIQKLYYNYANPMIVQYTKFDAREIWVR